MRERVHFISKELQGKHKTPPIYMIHSKDIGKGGDRSRKPGCEQGQIPWPLNKSPIFLLYSLSGPEWKSLRKSGLLVEKLRDYFLDVLEERSMKCCQRSWQNFASFSLSNRKVPLLPQAAEAQAW